VFYMDVAKLNRDRCYICCNGCTCILQASVLNVSYVFSDVYLQVCLSRGCMCFTHMLHVFYLDIAYILQ
jgi:hypothetical protein